MKNEIEHQLIFRRERSMTSETWSENILLVSRTQNSPPSAARRRRRALPESKRLRQRIGSATTKCIMAAMRLIQLVSYLFVTIDLLGSFP